MNDLLTLSPDAQPSFGSTRHFGSVSEPRPPNGFSPWVRPFPPRLPPGVASLFVQSLRKYYGLIRLLIQVHARRAACRLPEPARHTSPGMDETSQVPRKELLHVHKVSDCARFFPCKPFRHGTMLPSLQRKEIGTSELDPFIAVGTAITGRPPHRSERALLTHSAPTSSV